MSYRIEKKRSQNLLVRNLVKELIKNEKVVTNFERAKKVKNLTERVISRYNRRNDSSLISSLFGRDRSLLKSGKFQKIAGRFKNKSGGYTRLIKAGKRKGDNSQMALVIFSSL